MKFKQRLAVILSIAMVMCNTLPNLAMENGYVFETTESKIVEQLKEDLGEEPAIEILGAHPEDEEELVEEISSRERSSEPEEEEESTTLAEPEEETRRGERSSEPEEEEEESTTFAEPEEETRRGERSSEPETFSDNISTESEVEPVTEISIATKSKIDLTLYGGDGDPWMYWWLTPNDDGEDTKTIHYSNSDPGGGVAAIGITAGPYGEINYGLEIEEVEKITNAVFENGIDAETCKKFFLNFTNLKEIKNLNYLITNNVIDMTRMFDNCNELEYLDISNFNTSNVEVMEFMFTQCVKITILDLTNFNTLNVTNMSGMFLACNNLKTIIVSDDFSTKSVTNSDSMFEFCTSLVGGAGTNKGPVDKEYARIDGGPNSANPGYFSASPWMYWYLDGPDGDKTIHYTNSKPTSGGEGITRTDRVVYYGLTETDITKAVFDNNINAKSCANLFDRFYNLSVIEHLDYLKTSNVTRMDDMFMHCEALEILDLSSFNTENVEKMEYMFAQCYSLKKIIVSNEFVTTKVSDDGENMFDGCTNLVGGAGTAYDDSYPKDKTYARIDRGPDSATPGYFTYEAPPAPPTPPKPTPTPYIPSNDGGDGGGSGTGGPLVDMLIPAVTYLPIVKSISAIVNSTTSKWSSDTITGKKKLNVLDQNANEIPLPLGFYMYSDIVTHIVNNLPVQTQTNDTYVFDEKGNMITGWVRTADGKWYLFEYAKTANEGKMIVGWKKVQGYWYYFMPDGSLLTNAYTPDGYYVGADGRWIG